MRVGALDLGTNTFLLLVADVHATAAGGVVDKVVQDEVRIVRLGQEVHKNKKFHPEALERAEHTFAEFARYIAALKCEKVLACATSAARDVSNSDKLVELAAKYKIPLEIISGEREAELTFRGTVNDDLNETVVIIDVGGGSTEFILGDQNGIQKRESIDIGSVRLTELFVTQHPVPEAELQKMREYIGEKLSGLKERFNLPEGIRCLAVAGTPTTLAAMDQKRAFDSKLIQGHSLSMSKLKSWLERLADMGVQERRALPGMDAKRADVIVAGTMVLMMSAEAMGAGKLEVSVKGLRFGVAKHLAGSST